jgi:type I restriction enzyme, S subunit
MRQDEYGRFQMIGNLKPYPAMKDSGVPWLGKVPEHWNLSRMKRLLHERVEKGFPNEPLLAATQTKGVVKKEQYENRTVLAMKDLHLLKLVRMGDFVISLRSFQGGIEYAREQGIISPAYTVLYPAQPETHLYLAWLFKSKPYVENLSLYVTGIRQGQNIDYEKLSRSELPLPMASEQTSIVRFLVHYDRKIRRYIRVKQKLIKLLEEEKQAIIHRAVTRGLDPNVRLKSSGVEWLGNITENWEVFRLKEITTPIEQGWSPQCDAQQAAENEWGVLKVGCVNGDKFDEHQNKKLPSTLAPIPELEVRDGDILVSRANTRELLGLAALAINPRQRLMLCDKLFRFRAKSKMADPRFLVYAIRQRTSRGQIESSTNGASDSMQNIGQDIVRNLWLSLPSLDEQRKIVVSLGTHLSKIMNAIAQAHLEIALLREYRTRLIADVVTGKLDVREAAAKIQEDSQEPELVEEIEEQVEGEGEEKTEEADLAMASEETLLAD